MTWKYWTGARPLVVRMKTEAKLKKMGIVRGKELARIAYNRMMLTTLSMVWDHWRVLMDDFHEKYHSGPEHVRSKMLAILKIKREEEREAMRAEAAVLKLEVQRLTSKYRVEILPNGMRYLPEFDLHIPSRFPIYIIVGCLRVFRKVSKFVAFTRRSWSRMAESKLLENMVDCAVLANTTLMCCEHSRSSLLGRLWGPGTKGDVLHVRFQSQLELGFICLVVIYSGECAFKALGLGVRRYLRNAANLFDVFLVLVSLAQFSTSVDQWKCTSTARHIEECEKESSGLASLRLLRLVRVFRSIRRLTLVQDQLRIVFAVISSSYSLFMVMAGFIFIFASLGTQLFFLSLAEAIQDPHSVGMGQQVWIELAGQAKPDSWPGLPGTVVYVEGNNSFHLWEVDLSTSFSELGSTLRTVRVCFAEINCEAHINSLLPRAHFAAYSQSMLTVLQIMLRSGWIEIFENCVSGSGYVYPCIFFGMIFFFWSYFLGNVCSAVLIVGFSKKFEGEKKKLQALAMKEQKIQALHKKFKEALMAEYLRRIEHYDTTKDRKGLTAKRIHLNKTIMRINAYPVRDGKPHNPNLIHDPFENAFGDASAHNPFHTLNSGQSAQADVYQEYGFMEKLVRDTEKQKNKRSGYVISTDEIEIKKIQDSLMKMSNYEKEMFLREGLNNLQIGQHLAQTLGAASKLLQKRLENLRVQCNASPGPQHAAFFKQQIHPLERRIKEINERIEALQHGHQTGMALFLLRPYHPLRILSCNIVHRRWFERFMGTIVVASCITLWVQRPRMGMQEQALLDALNTVFNFFFFVECLLKVIVSFSSKVIAAGISRDHRVQRLLSPFLWS
jgi:hypothetical protein